MYNPRFEKDVFKRDVRNNVKTLFRKEVEEATPPVTKIYFVSPTAILFLNVFSKN